MILPTKYAPTKADKCTGAQSVEDSTWTRKYGKLPWKALLTAAFLVGYVVHLRTSAIVAQQFVCCTESWSAQRVCTYFVLPDVEGFRGPQETLLAGTVRHTDSIHPY